MPKKPFIDRKSAKHYHLVHRSQRDPLIVDEDAPQRVLKETIPLNLYKHKGQEEIDAVLGKTKLSQEDIERNVGKAALYGVFFDDADYDYTQHLRTVGEEPDAVILESPARRKEREKERRKQEKMKFIDDNTASSSASERPSIDLPPETLPSQEELPRGILAGPALPDGLQPDMDPRIREVIEALEDDAFVEEGLEDDFWGQLDAEGEPYQPDDDDDEEAQWEDYESEEDDGENDGERPPRVKDVSWEDEFKRFKAAQRKAKGSEDGHEDDGKSGTTGYSMSSSAMFRNKQLTLLDERFEKIEKEYEDESDLDSEEADGERGPDRGDLEAILDDFLDKYEVVGRKMVPRLEGDTAVQKLETIRSALLPNDDDRESIFTASTTNGTRKKRDKVEDWERPVEREREAWDVQSVLSTYSNLENHPKMIGVDGRIKGTKIHIDQKSGLPVVVGAEGEAKIKQKADVEKEEDEESEEDDAPRENLGAARPKTETPEEKRARKAAVKAAKQERRREKRSTRQAFKDEEIRQTQTLHNLKKNTGVISLS